MSLSLTLQSYLVQDALDHVPTRSHGTPFITTLHRCPVYEPTASCPARTTAPASRVMWCGATVRSPRETSSPLDYIHLLANYYVVGCNTLRRHHAHMPIPYLSPSCRSNTVPVQPSSITSEGRRDRVRQESHRSEEEEEELSVSPIPHPVRHHNTTSSREDTRSEHSTRVSNEPPSRLVERTAVLSQEGGDDDAVHVRRTAARSRSSCCAQRREGSRDDEQVTTSPRSSFSPSVPRPATMTSAARQTSVQTRQPSAVSHSSERSSNSSNHEQACSEEEHIVLAGVAGIATSTDSPTTVSKMMMMATTRWTSDAEEETKKKMTKEQQDAADTKEGSEASELRLTSQSHSLAPSEVTVSHDSLQQALLPTQRAKSHCTTTRAASVTLHEFYSRCYNDFMQRQRSHEAYGCRTSQETHHRSDRSRRNSGSDSMSSLSIACTASMSRVSRSAPRLSWAPPRHDQYYYHNAMNTVSRAVTTIHNGTSTSALPASRSASRETCSMPSSIAASHTCSETVSEGEQACLRHRRAQSVNNLVAELGLTSSRQRYSECHERRVVCTMLRYSEESAAAMQENRPSVQLQQQQHQYSCGAYPPRQPSTSRPTIQ